MWLFDKRDSPSLSEKVGTFIPLTHSPPIGFLLPAELFSQIRLYIGCKDTHFYLIMATGINRIFEIT